MKSWILIFTVTVTAVTAQAERWKGKASYYPYLFPGNNSIEEDCFFNISYPINQDPNQEFTLRIDYKPLILFRSPLKNLEHPATNPNYVEVPVHFAQSTYFAFVEKTVGEEYYSVRIDLDKKSRGPFTVTNIYYREYSTNRNLTKNAHRNNSRGQENSIFRNGKSYGLVKARHCFARTKLN